PCTFGFDSVEGGAETAVGPDPASFGSNVRMEFVGKVNDIETRFSEYRIAAQPDIAPGAEIIAATTNLRARTVAREAEAGVVLVDQRVDRRAVVWTWH